jgi:hypothetical protein
MGEFTPSDVGRKFNSDGSPRGFVGDTIICPLDRHSLLQRELTSIVGHWQGLPFAKNVVFLPPASYHMTVFSGADDQDRGAGHWPANVPLDVSISECDTILQRRVRAASFRARLPLKMRIDISPTSQSTNMSAIRLIPFDTASEHNIRSLRDQLAETLEIHTPDHDTYRFHISLGYWVRLFSVAERRSYLRALKEALARLSNQIHEVELGVPYYCTFKDMFAYHAQEKLKIV